MSIAIYFLISFLMIAVLTFLGWMSTKRKKRGATYIKEGSDGFLGCFGKSFQRYH